MTMSLIANGDTEKSWKKKKTDIFRIEFLEWIEWRLNFVWLIL